MDESINGLIVAALAVCEQNIRGQTADSLAPY